MKTIAAYSKKNVCVSILFVMIAASTLFAQTEEQAVSFYFREQAYRVDVQLSPTGCDVVLQGKGITEVKNLSAGFPGENLFPRVTVSPTGQCFTAAWMHFLDGSVELCIYDSPADTSRILPLEGFESALPLETVFYEGTPYLLLFQGNNTGNTDIFYYHLQNGQIRNITQTPNSEQEFEITDEENRFFIETKTLFHSYRYRVKKDTLIPALIEQAEIERHLPAAVPAISAISYNTILGFGDSITYGVVRMDVNDPDDWYHPEWTYLAQLEQMLEAGYGQVETVNAGVSRNTSYLGIDRMHDVFSESGAYFCLVLFGTNDVVAGISAAASAENLHYILDTARYDYDMYPIISTTPPQKDETRIPGVQFYKYQTEILNAAIIEMAEQFDYPYIDTYTAFMEYPEGYEALMELYKGNHPGPLGHEIMAGLFKEKILEVPPAKPANLAEAAASAYRVDMEWDPNEEFDFSHVLVEYGYAPDQLHRGVTVSSNHYTFIMFPYYVPVYSKLYFRLQAVDLDGNTSAFTDIQEITFGR